MDAQGERFTLHPFPNRFVFSREAGADSAPYLVAWLGARDTEPPPAPSDVQAEAGDLPAGEAWVSWVTPADVGPAGTLGFFVTVAGRPVPRYLIPLAGQVGCRVRMHLRDLGLAKGARVEVAVRAVDAAGNVGPPARNMVTVSSHVAPMLPGRPGKLFTKVHPLPHLGGAEVAVIDELDKVHPVSGAMIPKQPPEYLSANHLWSALSQEIELSAARNEFVGFQVLFRGTVEGLRPELTFSAAARRVRTSFGQYVHVSTPQGPLPDPVMPLQGSFSVPTPVEKMDGQKKWQFVRRGVRSS